MNFDDQFKSGDFLPDMQATNRWQAIDELVGLLVSRRKIAPEHQEAIAAAVKLRERVGCTAVGFGVALPHAETELVTEVVGVAGRSQSGINFEAADQVLVKKVLLFLIPKGQFLKHQHVLANLAKSIHKF